MSTMDSIASIRTRAAIVPMPDPHQTASGVITESPLILTDITTKDGVVGRSVIFTYTPVALKPALELMHNLSELVKGKPVAPREIFADINRRFRLLGTQGLMGMAIAAIDMALWDARARAQNTSLARLLGGTEQPIQAYGAIGYDGEKKSAQVAEAWAKRGFKGVKAKIGYPTLKEELAVIRAIRAAVGDDVSIMVDYNQSMTPGAAVERLRALEQEGLTWVEEPTMAFDFLGHAAIADQIDTPIQAGENWWGSLDVKHALAANAVDLYMLDVMKIGGVTGWMRCSEALEPYGHRVSSHLWPEISAQLLSVTPTAYWLEYADWWNPIMEKPLEIIDGKASTEPVLGSGVSWNEAAVDKYSV